MRREDGSTVHCPMQLRTRLASSVVSYAAVSQRAIAAVAVGLEEITTRAGSEEQLIYSPTLASPSCSTTPHRSAQTPRLRPSSPSSRLWSLPVSEIGQTHGQATEPTTEVTDIANTAAASMSSVESATAVVVAKAVEPPATVTINGATACGGATTHKGAATVPEITTIATAAGRESSLNGGPKYGKAVKQGGTDRYGDGGGEGEREGSDMELDEENETGQQDKEKRIRLLSVCSLRTGVAEGEEVIKAGGVWGIGRKRGRRTVRDSVMRMDDERRTNRTRLEAAAAGSVGCFIFFESDRISRRLIGLNFAFWITSVGFFWSDIVLTWLG